MPLPTWTDYRPNSPRPFVVAHRGASLHYRESSPEAFAAAIEIGADAIETDVRRTRDGTFVCHHDDTLKRTAGVDRAFAELSLAEFQHLAPDYTIRLSDVLDTLRGRCNLLLDLKLHDETDIEALVELLSTIGVNESVALGTRTLPTARLVRRLAPALTQLGLLEDPDEATEFIAIGGRWVRLRQPEVTPARIDAIHALGIPVLVMVGGTGTRHAFGEIDAADIAALRQIGVDGFMLNDPAIVTGPSKRAG
jgi:glycerophosphoryl diester phosphodiesterase